MIVYLIPLLLMTAFLIPVMAIRTVRLIPFFAIGSLSVAFAIVILSTPTIIDGDIFTYAMGAWLPPIGIVIACDSLSLLMAIMITGLGLAVAVFSYRYIKERQAEYFSLLLLFLSGMLGFSITGDLFNMYVFFEIMSVSSYALTTWTRARESLEGGIKYLIIGAVSTSLILLGIGLIYGLAGTFTLADIALRYQNNIIFTTALGLLLTGFAIKAAIVPFHFWKPDATVGAVEPVAALFSSLSVAMGFYGLTRMLFIFNLIEISWVLIGTGMLTMAVGAVMALIQADIKRLLAYSTISQMGFCLISLGTGTEAGISAALFQVLNNAIAKVVLFLCVGAIILSAGKSNMNELGGLARKMPLTAGCFLIGSLAVVGIPPLSGFASKYMIYFATWEVSPLLTAFALIFSGFTLAYYLKAFSSIFLGPESDINATKKAPATMLIPVIALSVLIVVIGFFPQTGLAIVEPATSSLLNLPNYISTVLGV